MTIMPIFIPHAGCPHQCIFCNQKTISGQKLSSLAAAREQIERWLPRLQPGRANEAAFYGGSFTALSPKLQESLLGETDKLLASGVINSVRLSTRPDCIDENTLARLCAHGVKTVELGVQSLDDEVLAAAERGHTAAAVPAAVALLRAYGFEVGVQLMVGMPKQSVTSLEQTVSEVAALKPDLARIYPLLVIKSTPLAVMYEQQQYQPLSLAEAVVQTAYVYRHLTAAGVKVIRMGLQPDDELCMPGNIVAGPFHPAFGELVAAQLYREQFTPQLQQLAQAGIKRVRFVLPPKEESKLRGLKNANLHYWYNIMEEISFVRSKEVQNVCVESI